MAENEIPQNHDGIEDAEIQPLSDEALEDVAGGGNELSAELADGSSNCCSCSLCS
jgi:hypothetical protein